MLENIALIKEVHELMPISKAEALAQEYLAKIALEDIGLLRLVQCTPTDIFYVMLIRALMSKEMNIIILTPFYLIHDLKSIQTILENMQLLNNNKEITIFDIITNEIHYEGCLCNTVK
ncbi:hypothetical protein KKG72_11165 [bacterium]|nr:hypothetical protein [bacterium]MBU1993486.1 hypothetical protein [bacterium]